MSREAYEAVIRDYETFAPQDAYGDKICVHEVSKVIRGEFRVEMQDKQGCDSPSCQTLKQAGEFRAEVTAGPCDSELSKSLDGMLGGPFVAAYKDADSTNRGGQTGKFKWHGGGPDLVGRMRGVINAGTHHPPVDECEKCHTLNHVEGWLRAAVVDGEHDGCRVAAMYALKLDSEGGFVGTLEGLLVCQCK